MTAKVINLEEQKERHIHKRKEARVDAMRNAFRLAREGGESAPADDSNKKSKPKNNKRSKSRKDNKKK